MPAVSDGPHFKVWQSDADQLWYWHCVGANGEIMFRSSEGYHTHEHAVEGFESAKRVVGEILVADGDLVEPVPDEAEPEPSGGESPETDSEGKPKTSGKNVPPVPDAAAPADVEGKSERSGDDWPDGSPE